MLVDVAAELEISVTEAVRHILTAPEGKSTICIQHIMDEGDIVSNLRHERVMIGSDGIPDLTGRPHPRLFGTFLAGAGQVCPRTRCSGPRKRRAKNDLVVLRCSRPARQRADS